MKIPLPVRGVSVGPRKYSYQYTGYYIAVYLTNSFLPSLLLLLLLLSLVKSTVAPTIRQGTVPTAGEQPKQPIQPQPQPQPQLRPTSPPPGAITVRTIHSLSTTSTTPIYCRCGLFVLRGGLIADFLFILSREYHLNLHYRKLLNQNN